MPSRITNAEAIQSGLITAQEIGDLHRTLKYDDWTGAEQTTQQEAYLLALACTADGPWEDSRVDSTQEKAALSMACIEDGAWDQPPIDVSGETVSMIKASQPGVVTGLPCDSGVMVSEAYGIIPIELTKTIGNEENQGPSHMEVHTEASIEKCTPNAEPNQQTTEIALCPAWFEDWPWDGCRWRTRQ